MPTLSDLQNREASDPAPTTLSFVGEEMMVADARATMTPAQMVEQKLRTVLHRVGSIDVYALEAGSRRRGKK